MATNNPQPKFDLLEITIEGNVKHFCYRPCDWQPTKRAKLTCWVFGHDNRRYWADRKRAWCCRRCGEAMPIKYQEK